MVFDTTEEEAAKAADIHSTTAIYGPVTICVGQKHVIAGLDEELVGKDVGTEADVTVPPEKAFGERDLKKVQSYPKNKFKDKPTRGMRINVEEHGESTVVDVIGSKVIVDFNQPLAGQMLTYHYKIDEIVTDPLEQFKGLIRLYAGKDMEVALDDEKGNGHPPARDQHDRRGSVARPYPP